MLKHTNDARPGEFPLGSPKSRAAARMLLKNHRDSRRRIELVSNIARPDVDKAKPYMSPWSDFGDVLMRMLYVPAGITEEEARKHCDQ
jgi:hypothetical protein